jgi:hypothetical protein
VAYIYRQRAFDSGIIDCKCVGTSPIGPGCCFNRGDGFTVLDRHIHHTSGEILIITDGYHRLCAVDAFA